MSGRRVHPGSGRNYHLVHQPPNNEGMDDVTGEPLIQREDDLPETVKHRLDVYHEETKPLVEYYELQSSQSSLNYIRVDGSQDVKVVFEEINKHF
jgi:adenylate kinase